MKAGSKGFTLIELLVAMSITALVSGATMVALSQIYGGTDKNNNLMTVANQVETAGYWITRDAQRATDVTTDNLTAPNFILFAWTEWDDDGEPTYYTATYAFNGSTLKRTYWSPSEGYKNMVVGHNLYYNPADSDNSSKAEYISPVLTVRLTGVRDQARETREYRVKKRPDV